MSPALVVVLSVAYAGAAKEAPLRFIRWEAEVKGVEKRLAADPPPKGGVVFAGSSSIRLWDLKKSFPDLKAGNAGFGGSEIRDCTFFAPRLVLPFEPGTVVFYAGDNDVASRRTPAQLRDDFAAFVAVVHGELPKCRILFVAVKPSIMRWAMYDTQAEANALIRKVCAADDRLTFVDVVPRMLGTDGKPRPELFVKDGLHQSEAGYAIWAEMIGELFKK